MHRLQKFLPSFKSSNPHDNKRNSWPPILVAIAPPLTHELEAFVTSLNEPYVALRPYAFVEQQAKSSQELLSTEEDSELKLLLLFFSERIDILEFSQRMSALPSSLCAVLESLVETAKDMYSQGWRATKDNVCKPYLLVDQDVSHSLHQRMNTKQAVKYADKLVFYADCVDVQEVLRLASKYQRPVRFLRHSIDTPLVSFPTLLSRAIQHLLTHNIYYTSTHLAEKYYVVTGLVSSDKTVALQSVVAEKLGYLMDDKGLLTRKDSSAKHVEATRTSTTSTSVAHSNDVNAPSKWAAWGNAGKLDPIATTGAAVTVLQPSLCLDQPVILGKEHDRDDEVSPIDILLSCRGKKFEGRGNSADKGEWSSVALAVDDTSSSPSSLTSTNVNTASNIEKDLDNDDNSTVVINLQEEVIENILHTIRISEKQQNNEYRRSDRNCHRIAPFSPASVRLSSGNVWVSEKQHEKEVGSSSKKSLGWYFRCCMQK
eukprot:gene34208-41408_t